MSIEGMDRMAREEFEGSRPRIFGTDPDHPENGRVFIWTKMGWFERAEGPWGDVAFTPVADSEQELRDWLAQGNPDVDLVEIDTRSDFGRMVYEEWQDNAEAPLYPEAPETSSQPPFEEEDVR